MQMIQPPPRTHRPSSGLYRTLLPYGELFIAAALLLIVLITG